jgi:hypothetical protein
MTVAVTAGLTPPDDWGPGPIPPEATVRPQASESVAPFVPE